MKDVLKECLTSSHEKGVVCNFFFLFRYYRAILCCGLPFPNQDWDYISENYYD